MTKFSTLHELTSSAKADLAREAIDAVPLRSNIQHTVDSLRNVKGSEPAAAVVKIVTAALHNADKLDVAPAQYHYELKRLALLLSCVTIGDL